MRRKPTYSLPPYPRHADRTTSHTSITRPSEKTSMTQMQRVDVRFYLVDDILAKVDKASMGNLLETPAPMLHEHLAEYVSSLPSTLRMRNGALLYQLKIVVGDLLPSEILAPPKHRFRVPAKHWSRSNDTGYADDWLFSSQARQRGNFRPDLIRDLWKVWHSTREANCSDDIWTLLCLEHWFLIYMGGPFSTIQPTRFPQTGNLQE